MRQQANLYTALFNVNAARGRPVAGAFVWALYMLPDGDFGSSVCEQVTHQILEKLNKTFVTPLDREDIHALTINMDDIIDAIELVADRLLLYRIERPTDLMISMVRLLERCCEQIDQAIPLLRSAKNMRSVLPHAVEINRLENEADKLSRAALSSLFDQPRDVLEVIKWKEVYDTLEEAIALQKGGRHGPGRDHAGLGHAGIEGGQGHQPAQPERQDFPDGELSHHVGCDLSFDGPVREARDDEPLQ